MTDDERRAIEQDCARLVTAFHVHVDDYAHDRALALFHDDIVVHHTVVGEIRGKAALAAYFDAKETSTVTLHATTNILIEVIDADHAVGSAYWTAYIAMQTPLPAPLAGPVSVGRYDDRFIRTADGWRFIERRQTPRFQASDLAATSLLKGGAAGVAKARKDLNS